jgi:hypothetical protein
MRPGKSNVNCADRRIHVDHRYEREYWSFVFGVSQQQLREAVRKARDGQGRGARTAGVRTTLLEGI